MSSLTTTQGSLSHAAESDTVRRHFGHIPIERSGHDGLMTYLRAIALRKWWIVGAAASAAVVATVAVTYMTPQFRSSASLLIEANRQKIVSIEEVYTNVAANREYFQTQAELIRSRDVGLRVVRSLKLVDRPEFQPSSGYGGAGSLVGGLLSWIRPRPPVDGRLLEEVALSRYFERLTVEPVRLSNIVRIGFLSADPDLAAAVANRTAEAFIQADMDNRYRMTESASAWINERLADLKKKLDDSEEALQNYRDQQGILDNKASLLNGAAKQMDELTQRLVEARVRRAEAEEAYNQVKAGESRSIETAPSVLKNPSVQKAKEYEADSERRLADASQRYGTAHPLYASALSELQSARENTRRQSQTVVASIVKEYNVARATERSMQDALSQSKNTIQDLNRKELQLGPLEREVASNRQLYTTFLSRYKETNATRDTQAATARIVDPAVAALIPAKPARARLIASAVFASVVLAAIAAVVRHRLDNTIRRSEDVESRLGFPLLSSLPALQGARARGAYRAVFDHPDEVFAESIRTASTAVLLTAIEHKRKIISISSSEESEGKTTFALNYALSQAEARRVLLIEADLRRPAFAGALNLPQGQKGLSDLISGTASLQECLLTVPGSPLHLISAGIKPPRPLELLASNRMQVLLSALQGQYDLVIMDCPPVQLVSDALVLGRLSTGVIFVVRAARTPVPVARRALDRFQAAAIPVLGVVLSQIDLKVADRYFGNHSGLRRFGYRKAYGAAE
ncbi:MAG TPA: polysaccharide biosynthesis tyrosine autokinase [Burkholderiaceae bacterium]|nr:polysaccharide biosynthesis tyrosine autokinase [Burkholderiaceae bacterium]